MLLAAQSSPVGGFVMTIAVLVISVVLVACLAWTARRLLGRPVGALRALVAGLLGFAAAELFGRSLLPAQTGHVAAFVTVALGIPLVVAMIFIVAAEVLVPSGTAATAGRRGPRHAPRAGPVTALLADQPDRGAARAGPLPARAAAARHGRGW